MKKHVIECHNCDKEFAVSSQEIFTEDIFCIFCAEPVEVALSESVNAMYDILDPDNTLEELD
tara:strand:- start:3018 stop:3203 length:186 start_codon:yes stop_codon:yes gene_type:complete